MDKPTSTTQYGITIKVTPQQIADLIISAFEHNSMTRAWVAAVRVTHPAQKQISFVTGDSNWYADHRLYDKASNVAPNGFSITVWEIEDESIYEGDLPEDGQGDLPDGLKKHEGIDLMRLLRGFEIMAEKSPYQFSEFMADNPDAITADVWFQCVVLGDVVYG